MIPQYVQLPRCGPCPRIRDIVPPSGPTPCPVLFLGECPSRKEDEYGVPFCGQTGQEYDQTYLPIANLPRSMVHVANAVYCSRRDYSNPEPVDAAACAAVHLGPLLSTVQPKILVPMGAVACSLFPGVDLNLQHGMAVDGTRWGPWEGTLFPMYHPSAGLHVTSYMIPLMKDFHELGKLVKRMGLYQ